MNPGIHFIGIKCEGGRIIEFFAGYNYCESEWNLQQSREYSLQNHRSLVKAITPVPPTSFFFPGLRVPA